MEGWLGHLGGARHLVGDRQADGLGHGQVEQQSALQSPLRLRAGGSYLCFWEKGWPRMAMCC